MSRQLIDISAPLSNGSPHWPGETPFESELTWRIADGDPCNVSRIVMSPHNGTHADAPVHFLPGLDGIGEVPLDRYIGPCWMVEGPRTGQVQVEHLSGIDLEKFPRVLVRTYDKQPTEFREDFVSMSVEAAQYLADNKAKLIGLDTASMDPFDSTTAAAHKVLLPAGIALLENLVLDQVEPGPYELIALPLKWPGLDASPVRAVLRTLS